MVCHGHRLYCRPRCSAACAGVVGCGVGCAAAVAVVDVDCDHGVGHTAHACGGDRPHAPGLAPQVFQTRPVHRMA